MNSWMDCAVELVMLGRLDEQGRAKEVVDG